MHIHGSIHEQMFYFSGNYVKNSQTRNQSVSKEGLLVIA